MTVQQSMIDELEAAIAPSGVARRAEMLRRVTDLFLLGSSQFSEDEIELFDDVMGRLCVEIETAARVALAARLADVPNAPRRLMHKLAQDDAHDVAAPVLTKSNRLEDDGLIEIARTKGQGHLLAISNRDALSDALTDVLIERGDQAVVLSTVKNPGARFSESSYSELVTRSGADDRLAVGMWLRADMPRHHLLRLFAEASEIARVKLEAADPRRATAIREIVAEVTDRIQTTARTQSREYQIASALVQSLHRANQLGNAKLQEFADAGKLHETIVALSLMCDLPISVIERSVIQDRGELVLILSKSIGLGWETTRSIILLRGRGCAPKDLEDMLANFAKLKPETAQKALRFYRLREQSTAQAMN